MYSPKNVHAFLTFIFSQLQIRTLNNRSMSNTLKKTLTSIAELVGLT